MTHILQKLLGLNDKDRIFSSGIASLEKITGQKGVDTRLIADILSRGHQIMRQLGLATHDTTGKELYFALMSMAERADTRKELAETDYVIICLDGELISMNWIDVFENYHRKLPYSKRIMSNAKKALRAEIINRYVAQNKTNKHLVVETASIMGLLPDSDAWYNNSSLNHKHVEKITRSGN